MATQPQEPDGGAFVKATGWRGAIRGLSEGAIVFLILCVARLFSPQALSWGEVASISIVGGICFMLGRALTGEIMGAAAGGVAGVFLAGIVGGPIMEAPGRSRAATPGKVFELRGPGLDRKPVDVADYRGKVVLVDFWATWCLPCREELPGLKETYEKYHSEGFEVVSVSLDKKRDPLVKMVEQEKIPWPQIYFDEPSDRDKLLEQYNIEGIPATFLLDREGRLVRKDLRGPEVPLEVSRLLGKGRESSLAPVLALLRNTVVFLGLGAIAGAFLGALGQRLLMIPPPPSQAGKDDTRTA